MNRVYCIALLLMGFLSMANGVYASETDQFMAMDAELEDSATVVNEYLNQQAQEFLLNQNARRHPTESPEKLTQEYYFYLFKGLHASRLRRWLIHSESLDRYPDESVTYFGYLRMSVFGMRAFPFILPMARTIRIGDVHLGLDKMGHFFGFGRRSFKHYLQLREDGVAEEEALERVILHGFKMELYFVGNLIDGIFSYADLEANYQGMMMAREFSQGKNRYFKRVDGEWTLTRPIDIRPYVTPDFDETYNRSHFIGRRKKQVFKVLREDYCEKYSLPIVQERFRRYDQWPQSFSEDVIDRYYAGRTKDPRKVQSLEHICEPLEE